MKTFFLDSLPAFKSAVSCCVLAAGLLPLASLSVAGEDHHQHHSVESHSHSHSHTPAPIGVMGDHLHRKGEWMFSYRYMYMDMDGNRDGSRRVSTQDVISYPNTFFGQPGVATPPSYRHR